MPLYSSGTAAEVAVLKIEIPLTNAEFKALPSTPKELLPAVAGVIYQIHSCTLVANFSGGAYTNHDSDTAIYLVIDPDNAFNVGSMPVGEDILGAANRVADLPAPPWTGALRAIPQSLTGRVGKKVALGADNPAGDPTVDFTGGDDSNTALVVLTYAEIEVS